MASISKDVVSPIRRQPVAEQVAQQLLGLIQSGSLRPGQQLPPERELATILDVSRPSLREALRALSLLGVVNIRQGGGVFVSALDPEALLGPLHFFISLDTHNIEALFEARIVIEPALTRMAAERIDERELGVLSDLVSGEDRLLDDPQHFIEADVQFHRTIFEAARNSFLLRVATSLHLLSRASREVTGYLPGVTKKSLSDHRRILRALEARDPAAAAAAMEKHLRNVRAAFQRHRAEAGG